MSAHDHGGHDEHGSHDSHGEHDSHDTAHAGHGGHDDHGHGGVGDYNTEPPGPSTLPAVPAWGLAIMGLVLAWLLLNIVSTSLALADADAHSEHHNESHGEAAEMHGSHSDKKAEH